jgi:hypothetical protein
VSRRGERGMCRDLRMKVEVKRKRKSDTIHARCPFERCGGDDRKAFTLVQTTSLTTAFPKVFFCCHVMALLLGSSGPWIRGIVLVAIDPNIESREQNWPAVRPMVVSVCASYVGRHSLVARDGRLGGRRSRSDWIMDDENFIAPGIPPRRLPDSVVREYHGSFYHLMITRSFT